MDGSFTSLILNLDATEIGTVDFTAVETDGQIFDFTQDVTDTGGNYFTFVAVNNQRIASVALSANVPVSFMDAAQFRIGGAAADQAAGVPEPAAMTLLGLGLLGMAGAARRRRV